MEAALAALKSKGWQKISAPCYYLDRGRGKRRLWLNFTTRKGATRQKRHGPLCDTEEDARAARLAFRLSWEASQRGKPCDPSKEDIDSASVAVDTTLPAGKW
ncbi:unnamed protein product [Ectocarpus sp. 12 AP-2014]